MILSKSASPTHITNTERHEYKHAPDRREPVKTGPGLHQADLETQEGARCRVKHTDSCSCVNIGGGRNSAKYFSCNLHMGGYLSGCYMVNVYCLQISSRNSSTGRQCWEVELGELSGPRGRDLMGSKSSSPHTPHGEWEKVLAGSQQCPGVGLQPACGVSTEA